MSTDRQQAIQMKLLKAKSMLSEAKVLLTKDLIPKTHSGTVNMLHQHFVQTGEFDTSQASFYSRLLQERIEEDYSDTIIEDEEKQPESLLTRPGSILPILKGWLRIIF